MTDEILSEIEKFFEENKEETQMYSDAFQKLTIDAQFDIIDSIRYIMEDYNLDVQQATIQVFNTLLLQMEQQNVYKII